MIGQVRTLQNASLQLQGRRDIPGVVLADHDSDRFSSRYFESFMDTNETLPLSEAETSKSLWCVYGLHKTYCSALCGMTGASRCRMKL